MKTNKVNWLIDVAKAIAVRSKDPSTKVGCVIVDKNTRIISTGFNGFVSGCDESQMSYERPLKYNLTIHAEMNAILFAKEDLTGTIAIVTHAPCDNCLKHLLQSGVRQIVFDDIGPMKERSSEEQKEAIKRLIGSTKALVVDKNGMSYLDLLFLTES